MHEAPQRIVNQSWPLRDRQGHGHARGIPDHPSIPVRARIVWGVDGEEWIDCRADRWTLTHVHVEFSDPRAQVDGVWLRVTDVRVSA